MYSIAVIVNHKACSGRHSDEWSRLQPLFLEKNILVKELDHSIRIEDTIQDLVQQGITTIVAAGGDGTISSVASVIIKKKLNVKLGILPFGTLNHFAKDLGIPRNLHQAFELILKGTSVYVDVVQMNNFFFINNSSMGVYAALVEEREGIQKKGWKKSTALFIALISVFKKHPQITINFILNGKTITKKTPFVFIGNNKYSISGFLIESRTHLDEGTLSIFIAHRVGRIGMLRLGLKAVVGNVMREKDFDVIGLQECTISSHKKEILVSYDGEVSRLKTPIHYKTIPKSLAVIVP